MLKQSRLVLLVILPMFLASCGSGGIAGIGGGGSMSLDDEWQLGQQLAAQVQQQVRLSNDARALSELRAIGERLHARTPLANRPFTFNIVDDPEVNAFAIPGGHIYINRGLIEQADRENMLASVVAHEMSHVVARHSIKQMEQANAINAIGSVLLGNAPAVAQIAGQIVAGGAMARFSRADEKQADDMGLELMASAGYNPTGMLDMFQKLLALDKGGSGGAVARFFQDHPGTQDRINDIQSRLAKMGNPTNGTVDTQTYHADLKDRV
jgi:predicted Zn-dependent protease